VTVVLKIHVEAVGAPGEGFVWWAESDDLPGFNGAADHLPDLMRQSTEAIKEITGDDDVEIVPQMNFDDEDSERRQPSSPAASDSAPATPVRQVIVANRMLEPA